jgi:Protein of unknown function (DUF4235)
MNLVFRPLGILSGALAGTIAQRGFERAWGLIDDQGPPLPNDPEVGLRRLAVSLALQGALSQLVRGFADHGTRRGFWALIGAWPE